MFLKTVFHETLLAMPVSPFLMKEPNFADAVMHLRKTPADETNAKKYVSLKHRFLKSTETITCICVMRHCINFFFKFS